MPDDVQNADPTVLVINDDAATRDSLALLFGVHGYRVVTAPDGRQGLIAFREHAPTVVVTDCDRLGHDGINFLLQIRRERSDVKIIALPGDSIKSDEPSIANSLGADAPRDNAQHKRLLIEMLSKLLMAAV